MCSIWCCPELHSEPIMICLYSTIGGRMDGQSAPSQVMQIITFPGRTMKKSGCITALKDETVIDKLAQTPAVRHF